MYDINDQVSVVTAWWNDINPRLGVTKPSIEVAKKFVSKKLFVDPLSAQNYLWKTIGEEKINFEFQDFLLIFLKGIVKDVICCIAKTVEHESMGSGGDKELLW
jgi:hypothetical protein